MPPDFSIHSEKTVGKRIASNAVLLIGAKAMGTVLGLFTLIIAARVLNPVELGTVVFLHAYMLFFGEVSTFKNWQSIIRFGADDIEAKDVEGFGRLVKFTARLDFISTVVAYTLAVSLISVAIWAFNTYPNLAPADLNTSILQKFVPLYCAVLLVRQIGTSTGLLRLFDRFGLLAIEALILPVLRLSGSILVWRMGGGFEHFVLVWFLASGTAYLAVISMALWELRRRRLLGHVVAAKQGFRGTRSGLWPFAIKSNIDSSIASGFMHLPLILVVAVFGPAWGAIYKYAEEVMRLLTEGFKLLEQVIYPELAKFAAQGKAEKIWPVVKKASTWMLFVGALSTAFIWYAGPSAMAAVFGETYRESAYMAALLVPGAALLGMVTPIYPIFYTADKPERAIYVRGTSLLVYIVAFFALRPVFGQMSPGWAIIVGNTFAVFAALIMARITLRGMTRQKS